MVKISAFNAIVLLACAAAVVNSNGHIAAADSDPAPRISPQVVVERITPAEGQGQGYRLVYHVPVPLGVYWNFKTDFNNTFLLDNKYIRDHRFVSCHGNIAVTENKYSYGPDVFFRWQTTLSPDRSRLDFVLLNPEECQQTFHYGSITLQAESDGTRVTQIAYFDFWGASFWAHYPWKGGMRDFLSYTAQWEQQMVLQLKDRYDDVKTQPD